MAKDLLFVLDRPHGEELGATGATPRRSVEWRYPYTKYNARPITSHHPNRSHASRGRPRITKKQSPAPTMPTTWTNGTRNGRFRSGSVYRSTMTPMQTSMNANSVPMLVRSYVSAASPMRDHSATKTPVISVVTYGV